MKTRFHVRVVRFAVLEELQGVWLVDDFLALLDAMEFGESSKIGEEELRDMCLMSLQDLEPRSAAALVLQYKLGNRLTKGEIDNMSNEMLEEKLWEEHADMALHEHMFNVGSLLYAAFPRTFPEPDAVRVTLTVTAANELAKEALSQSSMESFLVRLLSDGMDSSAVLHRLFDEQLSGRRFPEADNIVWTAQTKTVGEDAVEIDIISSGYWLDSLRHTKSYESSAYADERGG